jgi:hypothetical protein
MAVTKRGDFPIEGAMSDAGWYLIVAAGWNHRLMRPAPLARLSGGCELLTCTVDERNLSSAATGWRDGGRLWSVSYEGEERPGEVIADGEPPLMFSTVRQEFIAKSQTDDAGDLLLDPLFEIPIELVQRTVGYRADQPSRAFDGRYVMLQAAKPTLMQRLFGG